MLIGFLFNIEFPKIPKTAYIIGFLGVILLLYVTLVHKEKYRKIINDKNIEKKNNLLAILFPVIAFLILFLGLYMKMLQNQGKL